MQMLGRPGQHGKRHGEIIVLPEIYKLCRFRAVQPQVPQVAHKRDYFPDYQQNGPDGWAARRAGERIRTSGQGHRRRLLMGHRRRLPMGYRRRLLMGHGRRLLIGHPRGLTQSAP